LLIACPECQGKLSSAAPSCPHCGYVQKGVAAPATSAATKPPPPPPPELILPTEQHVKKAARQVWGEWVHSSVWRMFIGSAILLGALGLLFLVFMLAIRMNDGPTREVRIEKAEKP
jgi:hypothetical protein